jgi:hypothetical protein
MSKLFTGMSLVSQEEIKKANDDNQGSQAADPADPSDDGSQIDNDIDATPEDTGDDTSSFSLVSPEEILKSKKEASAANPEMDPEDTDPNADDKDDKGTDAYVALAKKLLNDGVISEFNEEDFDGTSEGLKKLVDDSLNSRTSENMDKFKNSFTGAEKVFLNIRDSFSSDAQAIEVAKKIKFYDTINDSDIENDKSVATEIYSEELRRKGYSDEQIEEELQDADDLGKLESKAIRASVENKKHYDGVVKKGKEDTIANNKKQESDYSDFVDKLKSSIDSREYIVKGLPFNDNYKTKLKSAMTEVSHTDKEGNTYTALGWKQKTNPQEFDIHMNYYNEIGLFDTDKNGNLAPNFSKINKIAKSKASSDLDKILSQDEQEKKANRTSSNRNNSIEQDLKEKLDRAGY